ncbi:MAG: phosphatidate cytidylyltransferase [Treponema sp.]|nr:phosphatidate cytidylyltransferase [Treponema sp.]
MKNPGIIVRKYVNDITKEIFRKSIHICTALVPFALSIAKIPVLIALAAVLIFYTISEFLRLKGKPIPFISAVTQAASRRRDENHFVLGPVTLALGVLITGAIFPLEIACVGIYALAFGDGLASLVGKLFGSIIIPFTKGKTVAGSLACFVAIFISSFLCTKNSLFALIIALVGMFIEVMPIKDFDNLLIPILLSFLLQLLYYFHK